MKLYIVLNVDGIEQCHNRGWGDMNDCIAVFNKRKEAENWAKKECEKTLSSKWSFIIIEKNI